MNRRTFIQLLAGGLVAVATPKVVNDGLELIASANAEERAYTPDEYYDVGTSINVMLGARRCPKAVVRSNLNKLLGFKYDEWFHGFFDEDKYSPKLQEMFRELDEKAIPINSPQHKGENVIFDYENFYKFNKENRGKFKAVTFWYEGFMDFGYDTPSYNSIVIPMDIPTIIKIRNL